jgi:Retroviral aspartyl protease.
VEGAYQNTDEHPVTFIQTAIKYVTQNFINAISYTRRRPYIEGTVLTQPTKFLYDTGSDITCISAEAYKQLTKPPDLDFTNPLGFKGAGGQQLDYLGTCHYPSPSTAKLMKPEYMSSII